jgi:uncharacterized protein YneF (UPF0154 family)
MDVLVLPIIVIVIYSIFGVLLLYILWLVIRALKKYLREGPKHQ